MKQASKTFCIHLLVFTILVVPVVIHAQQVINPTQTINPGAGASSDIKITNPFNGGNDLMSFITTVLNNVVMPIAAVAAVIYILLAGFSYVTARGNPKAIETAHQRLLWALIGTGILLGAAAISTVIQNTVKGLLNQ